MPLTKCFCGLNGLHNFGFLKLKAKGFKNVIYCFSKLHQILQRFFFQLIHPTRQIKVCFLRRLLFWGSNQEIWLNSFFFLLALFLSCVSVHSRTKKNLQKFLSLYQACVVWNLKQKLKEPVEWVDSDSVCGKYCARKNKSLNQNFSSSHQTKQGKHTWGQLA